VTSPAPLTEIGSSGVRTDQAPSSSTATISIASSGVRRCARWSPARCAGRGRARRRRRRAAPPRCRRCRPPGTPARTGWGSPGRRPARRGRA
jgi:hypothetical protein